MEIVFTENALEDLKYWKLSGNTKIQKRIQQLLLSIQEAPFEEHRLIYKIEGEKIRVIQLRDHY